MRLRARQLRTLSAAVFAGLLTMAVLSPSSGAAPASTPSRFETVKGEGAWSVFGQLVPWQNELSTASSYVDLNYTARGSFFGRQDLIKSLGTPETDPNHIDYAISGRPFTAEELRNVKGGSSSFIAAPVQATALAIFVNPPFGGFRTLTTRCIADLLDPNDPSTWPPGITDPQSQCQVVTPLTGPIRIPSRNLAAMFFHPGAALPGLSTWNNPDELKALGLTSTDAEQQTVALSFHPETGSPGFAGRSDPDETNYYMQQFVQTAANDVWEVVKNTKPLKPWEPITERVQQVPGVTRDGAEQQVDQLGLGCGVDGSCGGAEGGLAPAPPSILRAFQSTYPSKQLRVAEMQNANGEWVPPTAASITKAVEAGNNAPLFALTNKVAGAYPLVWVDNLYAPAHGLSVSKTESMATLIRYLATTGQDKEAPNGEGRLSAPLVAQALAAANQLVTSNCVGSDRTIASSSDPGRLAPPTAAAMRSIGNMLHCVATVPPSTTTVAPSSTTSSTTVPITSDTLGNTATTFPVGGGSSGTTTNTAVTPPNTVVTGPGPNGSASAIPTRQLKSGLLTAAKLPLPTPAGGGSSDRLATFLLGALLYLLVRKPIGRIGKRIAP